MKVRGEGEGVKGREKREEKVGGERGWREEVDSGGWILNAATDYKTSLGIKPKAQNRQTLSL